MGRPKKPTAIKAIQGSRDRDKEKGKTIVEAIEVPAEADIDTSELCEIGRTYFFDLWKKLSDAKVLSATDIDALKILADSYAQYWSANQSIKINGYTIITRKGVVKNPNLTIKHQAFERIKVLQGQFGLTPASRTNLEQIGGPEEEDPLDKIFNFGKGNK